MGANVSAAEGDALSRARHYLDRGQQLRPEDVSDLVAQLLGACQNRGASDLHLLPGTHGATLHWRIDGVLQPLGELPAAIAPNVVARLKVLADLLTYRCDIPQEGRVREVGRDVEMRLSTFPTLHGEKAVVRFFAQRSALQRLADLGLPEEIAASLADLLRQTSGALVICGPAGSGKTTTCYACLRELRLEEGGGRCLASLEDPVEVDIPGVAQSQVNEAVSLDLARGLRYLLRQDPEVIMIGEIRDSETARTALEAALTGHLILTTFHAGSAAAAVGRLWEMGLEPYMLRSGLLAVVCQRLLRRLCTCSTEGRDEANALGLDVRSFREPRGCPECQHTGYRGRLLLAEMLELANTSMSQALASRQSVADLQRLANEQKMTPLSTRAREMVQAGLTSPAEVRRVLGFEHQSQQG